MKISEKTWVEYITRLSRLNEAAGKKMAEYIAAHGTEDIQGLIAYAQALVQKYGEGSAELACQMYDAIAEASGVSVPPAEPAAPAGYRETSSMVQATRQSPAQLQSGVSRLVKQAGADTTLKNALRDGAEWAWVPHGDTCPFCITLASRGWQKASKKAIKGGHAQHIHAHCNCEYAIRFDSSTTVAGYDPDKYLEQYTKADGDINAMRRAHYAKHKDEINAQKRAAYAARHPHKEEVEDVMDEYKQKAVPGTGTIQYSQGYKPGKHEEEIKTAQWLHDTLGGDIVLLNEALNYESKMPDYIWHGKMWELKTTTTEKSADTALRKGLKQIIDNPGGIIIDYGQNDIDLVKLDKVIKERLKRSAQSDADVLVVQKGELVEALRIKKRSVEPPPIRAEERFV